MDPFFIDHAVGSVGRALEDRLPHLCANLVGTGDGLTFVGGSRVVAPTGVIAVEASRDKEELLLVPESAGMTSEHTTPLHPTAASSPDGEPRVHRKQC